jgi:DNA modification methylase
VVKNEYFYKMDLFKEIAVEYQTNKVRKEDNPFHNWYRFVLSFPPHLVKYYIDKFKINDGSLILDPFCGTGTTLVEAKLNGINSIGIEANPITRLATKIKLDWDVNPIELLDCALDISNIVIDKYKEFGIDDYNLNYKSIKDLRTLPVESLEILLKDSISPIPLHKSIILIEEIRNYKNEKIKDHLILASIKTIISDVSNLKFGPEVGLGRIKNDAQILKPWLENVNKIANDISSFEGKYKTSLHEIYLGDARIVNQYLMPNSISSVITSPPYPNEKDYSRTTRLENVLIGLVTNIQELRNIKKTFIRSNTRNIYKEDTDHLYVKDIKSIQNIAQEIEKKRIELNKTSGFEKMYSKVTLQYFGGMARHFSNLKNCLQSGAKLAYVVGDQSSYLRVPIRTGRLLAEIAENYGYKVIDLELFRTRFSTVTKEELREEVLIIEYQGK